MISSDECGRSRGDRWTWLPAPLFTAFLLGCTVSLLASGSLTLGRALPAALTWSFVPVFEIGALAAVWKLGPRPVPLAGAIGRFCAGNAPWWLWLTAFAACTSWFPAWIWLLFAAVVAAWSARLDYRFFRVELKSAAPMRDLMVERALAWTPAILLFGGTSLWPGLLEKLK
jgi:hypothetical protein